METRQWAPISLDVVPRSECGTNNTQADQTHVGKPIESRNAATRTLLWVCAIAAALFGAFWLLFSFASSTMIDPSIEGVDWWRTVLTNMFTAGVEPTSFGIVSLLASAWLAREAKRDAKR